MLTGDAADGVRRHRCYRHVMKRPGNGSDPAAPAA